MEISNEIKAKIFAQYFGQKVLHTGVDVVTLNMSWNWSHPSFKLTLRPLSEITDEDAIELGKIIGYESCDFVAGDEKAIYLTKKFITEIYDGSYHSGISILKTHYFLQSNGYDLPQYLLGGETLKEAGLAIY